MSGAIALRSSSTSASSAAIVRGQKSWLAAIVS
jgi:hypothetical protein